MLTMQYAKTIPDVRFNAADPGQTATEFTGRLGHSVEEGAEAAVRIAILGSDTHRYGDRPHRCAPMVTGQVRRRVSGASRPGRPPRPRQV
ncbi:MULTISPECIES: hypothetical protein [Streptomyces]|uniref:hypothetical protein n=1 Tax=Streptomyces TaxID=1883 RepID=UPI000A4ACF8A|nr:MULTISPECIES: hypothetical protein [Streptomyces]